MESKVEAYNAEVTLVQRNEILESYHRKLEEHDCEILEDIEFVA
jgi:hypothetical protein